MLAPPRPTRQALAACGLALGLALTLLPWAVPEVAAAPALPGQGLPGYDTRLRGPEDALALLAHGDPAASIESLNRLADESLAHGAPPPLRTAESWLLGCTAALVPDLRTSQDPRRLLTGGRGICSDAVIVLSALCASCAATAEMIDLQGHVVARVRRGGSTWIADPDCGWVEQGTLEEVEQPAGAARVRARLLVAGHPAERAEAVVRALASSEDNAVVPAGVLSPRLARAERALDAAGRLLPLALVAVCLAALGTARSPRGAAPAQGSGPEPAA